MIDWETIGQAMQEVPVNRQCWVAKYVLGHFATGKNMCRWKFQLSMQCPRCHTPHQDKQHILTCPAPIAQELWEKSLESLDLWLRTNSVIQENLMQYLRSWPLSSSATSTSLPFLTDQDAIRTQYIWDGWLC